MTFFKFYDQQFDSSIARDPVLRSVFNDMCGLADRNGIVDKNYQTIASMTRWPIETVIAKISELMKPDPDSRSKKCDGARLALLDPTRPWGWRIVNYVEYRNRRDSEARRTQNREAQQRWRDKRKPRKPNISETGLRKQMSADVSADKHASAMPVPDARSGVSHSKPESAYADADIKSTPLTPQGGNGVPDSRIPIPQDPDPMWALRKAKEKRERRREYVNGDSDDDEPEDESGGWTDELVAAARVLFPTANFPEQFDAMPADIRRQIIERAKKSAA